MANAATVKDVLYAMEYMHQELCRWPQYGAGRAAWSLEPSGQKVAQHVAYQARLSPCICGSPVSRRGEARYMWKAAA